MSTPNLDTLITDKAKGCISIYKKNDIKTAKLFKLSELTKFSDSLKILSDELVTCDCCEIDYSDLIILYANRLPKLFNAISVAVSHLLFSDFRKSRGTKQIRNTFLSIVNSLPGGIKKISVEHNIIQRLSIEELTSCIVQLNKKGIDLLVDDGFLSDINLKQLYNKLPTSCRVNTLPIWVRTRQITARNFDGCSQAIACCTRLVFSGELFSEKNVESTIKRLNTIALTIDTVIFAGSNFKDLDPDIQMKLLNALPNTVKNTDDHLNTQLSTIKQQNRCLPILLLCMSKKSLPIEIILMIIPQMDVAIRKEEARSEQLKEQVKMTCDNYLPLTASHYSRFLKTPLHWLKSNTAVVNVEKDESEELIAARSRILKDHAYKTYEFK